MLLQQLVKFSFGVITVKAQPCRLVKSINVIADKGGQFSAGFLIPGIKFAPACIRW
jgi:hypothetical protein